MSSIRPCENFNRLCTEKFHNMAAIKQRDLRKICEDVCFQIEPQVLSLKQYNWIGATRGQMLEWVKRAAVIRQFESAIAILSLVDSGHGATGVTMLRPAYEELLWIEYFNLCGDEALELVQLITTKEVRESYDAQKEFLGQRGIQQIGFSSRLSKKIEHGMNDYSKKLVALGKTLGWRNGSTLPSVAFIARKVKREKQYRFLYQGTSRSVHFSPHELQRRVWGEYGSVKIGSNRFERYWSDFAMSWSFRLLIETLIATDYIELLEKDAQLQPEHFSGLIAELRPVQILTATELESWDEPNVNKRRKN